MSYISWNCRGVGNPRTVRALNDLIRDRKSSFLFLIQTISVASKIEDFRVKFGFEHCFSVDRACRSGGLAILWKHPIHCRVVSYSQNHIDIVMEENNLESWHLSCFYGYPDRARRKESWDLVRRLASMSPLPWCIWGDFNDLLFASDKDGSNPHPQYLLDGFGEAIEDCHLSELSLSRGRFTWEKNRGTNAWVREKLDRAFANVGWWLKFPLCNLKVLHTSCSDHEPLLLDLIHANVSIKVFRFRFENIWLKEKNFIKDVSAVWRELPVMHLLPKLLSVSTYMARWGRTFFHKFREKIKSHKANLDRLVDCTDASSIKEYMIERDKLNNLLL